ncbi:MAG TPA: aminotransferase class V-fold PLP-dependent enzyme [Pyrinomonadaceae bacterium]|nr:aminotransferase class V-fold PLP-dependent enzyme [Pyrinomonadaceae bacterium]
MSLRKQNRRTFLSAATAGATGGLLAKSVHGSTQWSPSSPSEYLFADGLTYLNTGTIGPCRRETIDASLKAWQDLESMPVKFYGGFGAEALAEKTRTIAAKFLGCDIEEVVVTTSTTSGMNAVAQGLRLTAGDRILIDDQEHSGGLHCWKYFEKYYGVKIDTVAIPHGEFNSTAIVEKFKNAIDKKTKVISVSHVFSSTGLRMPVAEIAALARSNGVFCIVDGAQAAGAIRVNVKELGCHAYATSGHKWLMGPKGTGLLYISKDAQTAIRPIQFEESYKTYNNSNGVVNLPCILGLAKAIEYLETVGIGKVEEHNMSLRNRLHDKLQNLPNATIVSPPAGPLASPMLTLLLADKFQRQPFVKMLLDKHKLVIRPTHKEFGFNGIRFSMHIFNTVQEVDRAADILRKELSL